MENEKNQSPKSDLNIGSHEDKTNTSISSKDQFDYYLRYYETLTGISAEIETIYHNRTSIITLTLGLLLVGYQSIIPKLNSSTIYIGIAIGFLGLTMSILWYFLEQRNAIYYTGRGQVLNTLEEKLLSLEKETKIEFVPFWTFVPKWVKNNAKRHQRVSAPFILRTLVPLLFSITWVVIIISTPFISTQPSDDNKAPTVINNYFQKQNSDSSSFHLDTTNKKNPRK